jgi:hypothetical protein
MHVRSYISTPPICLNGATLKLRMGRTSPLPSITTTTIIIIIIIIIIINLPNTKSRNYRK